MKDLRFFKNMILTAAGILFSLSLTGCALNPFSISAEAILQEAAESTAQETTEEENLITVGVSQLGSESSWRTANTQSIQSALTRQNGYNMIFNNARQKQENQIKAIRSFISQRVDYIVFAPVIEDGWDTVLKEAKDAGIPVILMDRNINVKDESLYTTRVGIDANLEGERAGMWLEEELEKRGRADDDIDIVVIRGTTGSSSQRGRTAGFDEVSKKHNNWNVIASVDGDFTISKGKEAMEQILTQYSDFDVIISQNDDMTIGVLDALDKAGIKTGDNGDVMLISFDATKQALQLVSDGVINVDVECNPNQGPYISEVIRKLEQGKQVEHMYIVNEKVFTKDNVDEYIDDRTY